MKTVGERLHLCGGCDGEAPPRTLPPHVLSLMAVLKSYEESL